MSMPAAFSEKKNINAIIETPRGSRNKYNFDKNTGLFCLKKILPAGICFPLDFGFIPHTKAEDGDPMDILVFMDEPGFPGILVECMVVGIIAAEQEKDNKMIRNDRVVGVAIESSTYANIKSITDISESFLHELSRFFEIYHKEEGNIYKTLKIDEANEAINLINKNLK